MNSSIPSVNSTFSASSTPTTSHRQSIYYNTYWLNGFAKEIRLAISSLDHGINARCFVPGFKGVVAAFSSEFMANVAAFTAMTLVNEQQRKTGITLAMKAPWEVTLPSGFRIIDGNLTQVSLHGPTTLADRKYWIPQVTIDSARMKTHGYLIFHPGCCCPFGAMLFDSIGFELPFAAPGSTVGHNPKSCARYLPMP